MENTITSKRGGGGRYIIGIDEVGRGSLAGPVTVAAALVPYGLKIRPLFVVPTEVGIRASKSLQIKDSKQLTPKQREAWFAYLKTCPEIKYTVACVYPRRIEKINISGAANRAALLASARLLKIAKLKVENCDIFLDGGLFLGSRKAQPKHAKTIIKADEKIPAVSIASIIAKVTRDRAMIRLAKKYPLYGFDLHKGYGTKAHFRAIKAHGPSDMHRLTFLN